MEETTLPCPRIRKKITGIVSPDSFFVLTANTELFHGTDFYYVVNQGWLWCQDTRRWYLCEKDTPLLIHLPDNVGEMRVFNPEYMVTVVPGDCDQGLKELVILACDDDIYLDDTLSFDPKANGPDKGVTNSQLMSRPPLVHPFNWYEGDRLTVTWAENKERARTKRR